MTCFTKPIFLFIYFSDRRSEKFPWCNVIQQINRCRLKFEKKKLHLLNSQQSQQQTCKLMTLGTMTVAMSNRLVPGTGTYF